MSRTHAINVDWKIAESYIETQLATDDIGEMGKSLKGYRDTAIKISVLQASVIAVGLGAPLPYEWRLAALGTVIAAFVASKAVFSFYTDACNTTYTSTKTYDEKKPRLYVLGVASALYDSCKNYENALYFYKSFNDLANQNQGMSSDYVAEHHERLEKLSKGSPAIPQDRKERRKLFADLFGAFGYVEEDVMYRTSIRENMDSEQRYEQDMITARDAKEEALKRAEAVGLRPQFEAMAARLHKTFHKPVNDA